MRRSIDITGYDLGKWRNRGAPHLANGKRIPRTILVRHVLRTHLLSIASSRSPLSLTGGKESNRNENLWNPPS